MDRGAWRAILNGVAKESGTTEHAHTHMLPLNLILCSKTNQENHFEWLSVYRLPCASKRSFGCAPGASLVAHKVKNPPAMWETWVRSLDWEDPLEDAMATHSSIPAWRISMNRGAWRVTVHGVTKSWT